MRIVVNNIAASQTGALTILRSFYEYVAANGRGHEWIFLLGGPYVEELPHVKVRVLSGVKRNWINRLAFDLVTGRKYIEALDPDVVFSMQNTVTFGLRRRQVIYVHQPLGFQNVKRFSFLKAREREYAVYQHLIGPLIDASVKRADYVIVQTGWMREAVIKKDGISPGKIEAVMPDMPTPPTADNSPETDREPDCRSFFFPSGDIIYKNHETVVRACRILNSRGIDGFNVLFTLKGLDSVTSVPYDNSRGNITCVDKMGREEVFRNYRERVLIFPSYIETLGLPLLEARSVGGLILASDCPFCHEILDDYENTYFFPPFDAERLADYMEQVMDGRIRAVRPKTAGSVAETGRQDGQSAWARVAGIVTGAC